MKITISPILTTLILLLTTTTLTPLTAIIHDTSGNKLLRGIPYHILPVLSGSHGGLTVTQTTKNTCPLNITQEPFQLNNGVPFTFTPIILNEPFVHASHPLSIQASIINPCSGSNIWKVTTSKTSTKQKNDEFLKSVVKDSNSRKKKDDEDNKNVVVSVEIVTTSGEFNKPESCFQIVEDEMMVGVESYQIQNCPFKCGSSGTNDVMCYNVGVVKDEDGNRYLGRTDVMFPVVFVSSYGTF